MSSHTHEKSLIILQHWVRALTNNSHISFKQLFPIITRYTANFVPVYILGANTRRFFSCTLNLHDPSAPFLNNLTPIQLRIPFWVLSLIHDQRPNHPTQFLLRGIKLSGFEYILYDFHTKTIIQKFHKLHGTVVKFLDEDHIMNVHEGIVRTRNIWDQQGEPMFLVWNQYVKDVHMISSDCVCFFTLDRIILRWPWDYEKKSCVIDVPKMKDVGGMVVWRNKVFVTGQCIRESELCTLVFMCDMNERIWEESFEKRSQSEFACEFYVYCDELVMLNMYREVSDTIDFWVFREPNQWMPKKFELPLECASEVMNVMFVSEK